jgi:hypothetical protein
MKKIKLIFGFVFLIAIAISCTVDGIDGETSMLDSVTAPSEVLAFYNITQDNTGSVTITPNGEGAVSYDIYYGDDTTAPDNVLQGKSTTHIYKEGTYDVKIVAVGITGLKMEMSQSLVVSFKAPENLEIVVANDLAISKKVNVTATADYSTMYDVYFGETGNDVPVSANNGETASYTYKTAGTYKIRVVSKSAAIQTTEKSQDFVVTAIEQPTASAPTQPFRKGDDVISIFSSSVYDVVTGSNYFPYWDQQNWSTALFQLKGDEMLNYINLTYQGIQLGSAQDASSMEYLHVDIWSAADMSIKIFPLQGGVDNKFVTKTLIANQWNSFDIPLSEFTSQGLPLDNVGQFMFVGSPEGERTVFIDNLYFYKGVPESIQMPLDFESTQLTYTWNGFGRATATLVDNPQKSGSNLSNKVVRFNKQSGSEVWAGASINLDSPVNFANGSKVSINIWSPRVGAKILFKMENSTGAKDGNGNPAVFVQVEAQTTVANSWQVLTFDLTDYAGFSTTIPYDRIIFYNDNGTAGTGTDYYFDDIEQFK